MDMGLNGRVALITGSTRGLGRAIAEALALEGVTVIINGRRPERVASAAKEIGDAYRVKTYSCCCYGTDPKSLKSIVAETLMQTGGLDILVNNIGNIEKFGRFEDLEDEDWLRMNELGCMSAVRFIKAALPFLKKSNQARIINIGSLSAHQPSGLNPHYGATKAGVLNLTKNLAQDFGKYGIRVNSICPSTLAGGGWYENVRDRAQRDGISVIEAEEVMQREEFRKSPLNKIGRLGDVANLVCYLASYKAGFLTGHCYNVDGGITRAV